MAREWIAEKMLQKLSEDTDDAGLSVGTLADAITRPPEQTRDALQAMLRRNLVIRQRGPGVWLYRLTPMGRLAASNAASVRAGAAGAPRAARDNSGSLRARAWKALRMEGSKSTLGNILNLVLEGEEKSPGTNLLTYFNALCKAGILTQSHRRVRGSSPTSNGFVVWMILDNVGPRAPIYQPTKKQVFDPNSNAVYPLIFQ